MRFSTALALVVAASALGEARAGDPPKPAADPLQDACTELEFAELAASHARRDAFAKHGSSEKEAAALRTVETKLLDLCAKADWTTLGSTEPGKRCLRAIWRVGNSGLRDADAELAVRAFETALLARPNDATVETKDLPAAYVLAGETAKAQGLWERAAKDENADRRAEGLLGLGDLRALEGDLDAAKARWKEVQRVPHDETATGCLEQFKRESMVRVALIGRPAPELVATTWIGDGPKSLADRRGSVVVFQVFATDCGSCRDTIGVLRDMSVRHAKDGLLAFAATTFAEQGRLPEPGAESLRDTARIVRGLTPETYPDHVRAFRENARIDFPVAIVEPKQLLPYLSVLAENVLLIDRAGRIAFATPGGAEMEMVEVMATRLLAGK